MRQGKVRWEYLIFGLCKGKKSFVLAWTDSRKESVNIRRNWEMIQNFLNAVNRTGEVGRNENWDLVNCIFSMLIQIIFYVSGDKDLNADCFFVFFY